jgi:hypothetical protein
VCALLLPLFSPLFSPCLTLRSHLCTFCPCNRALDTVIYVCSHAPSDNLTPLQAQCDACLAARDAP